MLVDILDIYVIFIGIFIQLIYESTIIFTVLNLIILMVAITK